MAEHNNRPDIEIFGHVIKVGEDQSSQLDSPATVLSTQEQNRWPRRIAGRQQITEVSIGRDDYAVCIDGDLHDLSVIGRVHSKTLHVHNIVTRIGELCASLEQELTSVRVAKSLAARSTAGVERSGRSLDVRG